MRYIDGIMFSSLLISCSTNSEKELQLPYRVRGGGLLEGVLKD